MSCDTGFNGPNCDIQQCYINNNSDIIEYCHNSGLCVLNDTTNNYSCECFDGYLTSGFDCVVDSPRYLGNQCSIAFICLGICLIVVGVIFIFYKYTQFKKIVHLDEEENLLEENE